MDIDWNGIGRYLFVLAFALIIFAYYKGSTAVLATTFTGVNRLGNTFTGRTNGTFANYPGSQAGSNGG